MSAPAEGLAVVDRYVKWSHGTSDTYFILYLFADVAIRMALLSAKTKSWLLNYGPYVLSAVLLIYRLWRQYIDRQRYGTVLSKDGIEPK